MKKIFAVAGLCLIWQTLAQAWAEGDEPPPVVAEEASHSSPDKHSAEIWKNLNAELELYRQETSDFKQALNRTVYYSFQRKQRTLAAKEEERFRLWEAELRVQREKTIQIFEAFIERYPDRDVYTPDALFRLADLYFDRTEDNYNLAKEQQEKMLENASEDEEPDEIVKDYSQTIETFDRLIRQWPQYAQNDGAYYLSGYCLLIMQREQEAKDRFARLIEKYPESPYISESWMRLGEYYFAENKFKEAATAYEHACEYQDSAVYSSALYKLAWTYYLLDRYPDAIAGFHHLLQYGEELEKSGKDLQTRDEAIQYLAIAVQEEDWDGDGLPDADAGLPRVKQYINTGHAYETDVLFRLIDVLLSTGKYEQSIDVIRYVQALFPTHPRHPEIHFKLFEAYGRLQRTDDVIQEKERLYDLYGENSAWYKANAGDKALISRTKHRLEDALAEAANYLHLRAQSMRSQMTEEETIAAFERAARSYKNFLTFYPQAKQAYDFRFYYADTLYYSFHFEDAIEQYTLVRDDATHDEYRENAAYSLILARENLIREQIQKGLLASKPTFFDQPWVAPEVKVASSEEGEEGQGEERRIEIPEEPIPVLVQELQSDRQAYVDAQMNSADDPRRRVFVMFKIGEVYLSYHHFAEARQWFERMIREAPSDELASIAANEGFETYRLVQDWEGMSKWSGLLDEMGIGDEQFKAEIAGLKVGAIFKLASKLFKEEKYEEAAAEYLRLLEEDPGTKYADRALFNAGVAYEQTRRFESAARMFRRVFTEHPDSARAPEALFRLGVNAERFYDYDLAVKSFLSLVDKYKDSQLRADALYRAAEDLEYNQEYGRAAANYERYAELFPSRSDTAETFYRSADVYRKVNDLSNELRICETFLKRYKKNTVQSVNSQAREPNALYIEVLARTVKLQRQAKRLSAAAQTRQLLLDEFQRRGLPLGSPSAAYAAEALFDQIEKDFEAFTRTKLSGSVDNQGRTLQKMQKQMPELIRRYHDVQRYLSPHWSLAAGYREGYLYQYFAEALFEAEIPSSFTEEMEDMYRSQLEEVAIPLEDEAQKHYREVLQLASKARIRDEWTKRSLEALNKYDSKTYPVFVEEHSLATKRLLAGAYFIKPSLNQDDGADAEDSAAEEAQSAAEGPESTTPASESASPDAELQPAKNKGDSAEQEASADGRPAPSEQGGTP